MHKNRCKYTDFSKYQQIIPPFFRLSYAKMLSPIITFYQTTANPPMRIVLNLAIFWIFSISHL